MATGESNKHMSRTLAVDVSSDDHLRGTLTAPSHLVIYGDYECPYTRKALISVAAVREALGESLVFAYRNFPLTEIHPHALHAALAAEAADRQGKFWEMHDLLFGRQNFLEDRELLGYAGLLGLDEDRFREDFEAGTGLPRIESDVRSGERNGVQGTPTIFVNGRHHRQGYDPKTLASALATPAEA
jgi:protein-disulfide isomerase